MIQLPKFGTTNVPNFATITLGAEDQNDIDQKYDQVHGTLQHVGAHAAESKHAEEEGQNEQDQVGVFEAQDDCLVCRKADD